MVRIVAFVLAVATVAHAKPATKKHPAANHATSRFDAPHDADQTPAVRYARLSAAECEAELTSRGIAFDREAAAGVFDAVRLAGPLHGVTFRTDLGERARATTPYEIADCRLVLALDDFATILAAHDIVEVKHYSIYRPPSKGWPDDKLGGQHNGGLALDAARFTRRDGTGFDVVKDFHGAIGAKTCGEGAAPHPADAKSDGPAARDPCAKPSRSGCSTWCSRRTSIARTATTSISRSCPA